MQSVAYPLPWGVVNFILRNYIMNKKNIFPYSNVWKYFYLAKCSIFCCYNRDIMIIVSSKFFIVTWTVYSLTWFTEFLDLLDLLYLLKGDPHKYKRHAKIIIIHFGASPSWVWIDEMHNLFVMDVKELLTGSCPRNLNIALFIISYSEWTESLQNCFLCCGFHREYIHRHSKGISYVQKLKI